MTLESVITYVLMTFCGGALSVGAWFFKGLDKNVKTLTEAVSDLKTEIAVMRRDAEDLAELRQKLERLNEKVVTIEAKLEA